MLGDPSTFNVINNSAASLMFHEIRALLREQELCEES